MAFTKQHFERIANVLKAELDDLPDTMYGDPSFNDANHGEGTEANHDAIVREAVESVAKRFAERFARENSNFERDRFLRACGLNVAIKVRGLEVNS